MWSQKFGIAELDLTEYRNFLFGPDFLFPTRPEGIYTADKVSTFFQIAQGALARLLSQAKTGSHPKDPPLEELVLRQLHIFGHGMTFANRDNVMGGWSGTGLCPMYMEKGIWKIGGIETALAQAGASAEEIASFPGVEQIPSLIAPLIQGIRTVDPLDSYYLRLVSDQPRSIMHALLFLKDKEIMENLLRISDEINREIKEYGNVRSMRIYRELMNLAIENGFIPVPALRTNYYGPLEMAGPEKWKPEKMHEHETAIRDALIKYFEYTGLKHPPESLEREVQAIAAWHQDRKGFFSASSNDIGIILSETRARYLEKIQGFYHVLNQVIHAGEKILIVTTSGFIDVTPILLRNLGKSDELHFKRPDKKIKGAVLKALVGYSGGVLGYINDPEKLEPILEGSEKSVTEQRQASLDEAISTARPGMIIPAALLGFEKKETRGEVKYTPYSLTIEDILNRPEPSLLLGNFGQGKSTAAVDLAERLNSGNLGQGYIAVHITASELNRAFHNQFNGDASYNERRFLEIISRGVVSLPKSLRDEHKFVFIVDALDELTSYRSNVLRALRDVGQLKDYGKVILTSRFTGFEQHENQGFETMHIDSGAVLRNIDKYLAARIVNAQGEPDAGRIAAFNDFLGRQNQEVKSNYLLVHFLTDIYNKRPDELGGLKGQLSESEILLKGIEVALWEHKLRKDPKRRQRSADSNQSREELATEILDYEHLREKNLLVWTDLLARCASYMTVHNLASMTLEQVEIVNAGWTLKEHLIEIRYQELTRGR